MKTQIIVTVALSSLLILTGCRENPASESSSSSGNENRSAAKTAENPDFRTVEGTYEALARAVVEDDKELFLAILSSDSREKSSWERKGKDDPEIIEIFRQSLEGGFKVRQVRKQNVLRAHIVPHELNREVILDFKEERGKIKLYDIVKFKSLR